MCIYERSVIRLLNQAETKICLWRTRQLRKTNFRMCIQSLTSNSIFITNSVHASTKSSENAEEQTLNFAFETSPSCGWVDMEMKGASPFNKLKCSCLICGFFAIVKYEWNPQWYCYFNSHGILYLAEIHIAFCFLRINLPSPALEIHENHAIIIIRWNIVLLQYIEDVKENAFQLYH